MSAFFPDMVREMIKDGLAEVGMTKDVVATKLAQANDLARQGKLQSEIARTLGVSVMTLHRWRKADGPNRRDDRIAELQLEISRLRRLVADLLLVKLEEAAQRPKIFGARGRRGASR
jgi:putative transposase